MYVWVILRGKEKRASKKPRVLLKFLVTTCAVYMMKHLATISLKFSFSRFVLFVCCIRTFLQFTKRPDQESVLLAFSELDQCILQDKRL